MNNLNSSGSQFSDLRVLLPGTRISRSQLSDLGFLEFELEMLDEIELPTGGFGINWNTKGDIPESGGIYAFTVEDGLELRVTYVGKTMHLWMVTKGLLPRSGGARGGQRYGRPKHAGETRRRINVEIASQIRAGRKVKHWTKIVELEEDRLRIESELIANWDLRKTGWNRG